MDMEFLKRTGILWYVDKDGNLLKPFVPVAGSIGAKIKLHNVFARYPVRRKI